MATNAGGTDTRATGIPWQSVLEAGLATAAVGFLYWCLQAGFYGAFGIGPADVGIDVGTPTELAVGSAYVGAALALALIIPMSLVAGARKGGHRWQRVSGWILNRRFPLPVSAAIVLIVGLAVQAGLDGAFVWRTLYPAIAIVVGGTLLWLTQLPEAAPRPESETATNPPSPDGSVPKADTDPAGTNPGPWSTKVVAVSAVLALAAAGMAVNSWGYHLGLRFRTAHPSAGTFLIGHTPSCAYVTWTKDSSPPAGFAAEISYTLIVLADTGDDLLLYERPFDNRSDGTIGDPRSCTNRRPDDRQLQREADLVYKVPADDVQVARIPKDHV